MHVHEERIPEELFSDFVAHMPQVCVEVVVERDGEVLLTKRANEPVQGEWFWPGGRLLKGEGLENAAHRIAGEELGIVVEILDQLGVYAHFWDTSAEHGNPSRHTVNVVYQVTPTDEEQAISLDDQHTDLKWISEIEDEFHEYVKRYLDDSGLV